VDPLSHAALAASWAKSTAKPDKLVPVIVVGAVAGMAPDADILIRSSTDPLILLEYHRHFTHALAFVPIGAAICTLALYYFVKPWLSLREIYGLAFVAYASHGLLDCCTTYGTLLLWPFSDARIAWNNVSVVDPLFTVPILALLVIALRRRQRCFALFAALWGVSYLGLGVWQNGRATEAVAELAAQRGHGPARIDAMPSFGSLLLWKTIYEQDGRFFVDAVHTGFHTEVFPGSSIVKLDIAAQFDWLDPSSQQGIDVERFRRFTAGFVAFDGNRTNAIVDIRYSMVPDETDALWGITLDRSAPRAQHVGFYTNRTVVPGRARRLFDMMF
jgi:inner membrane protein